MTGITFLRTREAIKYALVFFCKIYTDEKLCDSFKKTKIFKQGCLYLPLDIESAFE